MTKHLLALAAFSAASLSAATLTFSVSTSPSFDPGPTVSYSTLLNLPGFNGALGTLTGVNLYIETQMNQGGTWRNDGGNQTTYGYGYIGLNGNPAARISVNGLGLLTAFIQDGTSAFTGFRSDTQNPGQTGTFSTIQEFANNGSGPLGPSVSITGFSNGGANIPYSVDAVAGFLSTCGNGNCFADIQTRMGARITVTYTYDERVDGVPEPATQVLVGAGLLLVGLVSRRFAR
jgi:hypothetical protein